MTQLSEHPTVKHFHERAAVTGTSRTVPRLSAEWLRSLCFEAGADEAGFVEIGRPELADQRSDILSVFPWTKTLVSIVCRMNRENVRSTARSIANLEFHSTGEEINTVARKIVAALERHGIRASNPTMGFPMEMQRWPGKIWTVSHKPVAVAAGLGRIGIHRNVIHPRFGNFILLGTVLIDAELDRYDEAIEYNPCLECKLCVAACPVGAIGPDGHFNFSACYTHNYREFMGGFSDWVETIADSKDRTEYRSKVQDPETVSIWQSLSFGANYKAAYCMAVCPAGEEVIGPFLTDRPSYLQEVVKPLQEKEDLLYVIQGSDAEQHAWRRFPHKRLKRVGNGLRPLSILGFLKGLPHVFQRNRSDGLNATYHFSFTGEEKRKATVIIRDCSVQVLEDDVGTPNLIVTADSRTWLRFLAKEANLPWALLRRKIRIKGSPRLLLAFGRCFPS